MPYIETLEEIVESLADSLGIYNQKRKLVDPEDEGSSHTDACGCRQCWGGRLKVRIRTAVYGEAVYTEVRIRLAQAGML